MNQRGTAAARFSAAAATYDRHASVHERVADRVLRLVPNTLRPVRILDVGCGTGILTERIAGTFPDATVYALDPARGMIAEARKRLKARPNIKWMAKGLSALDRQTPFDLVVSSSSLHWIVPMEKAFQTLRAVVADGAHVVFGLMARGTFSELHAARARIAPHKPVKAVLPKAEDVLRAVKTAGFQTLHSEQEETRIFFPTASDFLRAIHEQGVTGGLISVSDPPLNRGEIQKLIADYDAHYKHNGDGIFASYNVLYVDAK